MAKVTQTIRNNQGFSNQLIPAGGVGMFILRNLTSGNDVYKEDKGPSDQPERMRIIGLVILL